MYALVPLARNSPIPVRVRGSVGRLPEPVEAALYFVCSEGLANAVKHSHASLVTIEVGESDGRTSIAVVDDGVGGAVVNRGSGLSGLADRVEALGGTLGVESPPGGGTHLAAELPTGGR
jgi:signal transduction histidine kinase